MMRWWTDEAYSSEKPRPPEALEEEDQSEMRNWIFIVRATTTPGEVVCVTGNCEALGNWKHDKVLVLSKEKDSNGNENVWAGQARIPLNVDVEYRYVISIILDSDVNGVTNKLFSVRRWETNLIPRMILKHVTLCKQANLNLAEEVFGSYNNKEKVERGWLTSESAIQLKLFNNALQMWKTKLQDRTVNIKVTPISLLKSNSVALDSHSDECISLETMDLTDKLECWPVVEVSKMNQVDREFKAQEQFGKPIDEGDFTMFQILVDNLEAVAFLVDYYSYPSRRVNDEPPCHLGFSYILPSAMKYSEGQAVIPITSVKHRPIGQLTVEYLFIKPIVDYTCDLRSSFQKQWKESWRGLDVGHRGVGTSFKGDIRQCAEVRENTIASLKAAASHGADFVEFDVQLTKDLIPVLYHDFYVGITMKRKKQVGPEEMMELPLKDLSLAQLHLLKFYHVKEQSGSIMYSDEDLEEHQPFPTLKQALEVLDECVGFDIEIKWTMQLKDGTYELYHPFDLNLYLDTVLEVVLRHGGKRNIVFSCFHPDICSMIRLKQNKYPVMFLTQGITDKYPPYHDPRCQSIPMAVNYAVCMDILGINVHTEDLLRDSSQVELVKNDGLVLFCWGDDNNDTEMIKHLKEMGIDAVIYDKIDQIGRKEVKESIFRLESRESERVIIKEAADKASSSTDDYLHNTPEEVHSNLGLEVAGGSLSSSMSLWTKDHLDHSGSTLEVLHSKKAS